jgi:hypothetical protein
VAAPYFLAGAGLDAAWRDPLLGIVEQRWVSGRNGALWQAETVHHLEKGSAADRTEALRLITRTYMDYMHLNAPAHTWDVD